MNQNAAEQDLELAKELLREQDELLAKMIDIGNEAIQLLLDSSEIGMLKEGFRLGEKVYDVLQYSLHLESDERFQQFYRQESAE